MKIKLTALLLFLIAVITHLKVSSKLGGDCRRCINSDMKLNASGLFAANGQNAHPFYEVLELKTPLIPRLANLNPEGVKAAKEYDLKTEADEVYTFKLN